MAKKKQSSEPEEAKILRFEQDPHAPAVFTVESASTVVPDGCDWRDYGYRVEIDSNPIMLDGKLVYWGNCSCAHFMFRLHKLIKDNVLPRRCGHIKLIRHAIADDAVACWVASQNKPTRKS